LFVLLVQIFTQRAT